DNYRCAAPRGRYIRYAGAAGKYRSNKPIDINSGNGCIRTAPGTTGYRSGQLGSKALTNIRIACNDWNWVDSYGCSARTCVLRIAANGAAHACTGNIPVNRIDTRYQNIAAAPYTAGSCIAQED